MNEEPHIIVPPEGERRPIVFTRGAEVFANSRDVAAYFAKQHRNVLEAVDNLIVAEPDLGLRNFRQTPYVEPTTGQTYRSFDMDRRGFTLLAMGFTGAKALKWKLTYIDAFELMEAELRARPVIDIGRVLSDPNLVAGLLLEHTTKRIDAERRAAEAEGRVAEMAPKAEAHDRIADAHGTFCRSTAAKMLAIQPHTLIRWMRTNGWTFRRPGDKDDLAYQSKIATGLLEHKITTGQRPDGSEWSSTQVRVTGRGMTVLAKAFPPAATAA